MNTQNYLSDSALKKELEKLSKHYPDIYTDNEGWIFLSENEAYSQFEKMQKEKYGSINFEAQIDFFVKAAKYTVIHGRIYYPAALLIDYFETCFDDFLNENAKKKQSKQ